MNGNNEGLHTQQAFNKNKTIPANIIARKNIDELRYKS